MAELQKEKFDQPMEFDQYLGHLDLERHPLWEKAWKGQNQKLFEQVLYEMGADLNYGYEFTTCIHRARTSNAVEYGMRVSFKERTDKWWVNNMMAVSDMVRNTHNSIRATGMREALNEDNPLNEAVKLAASQMTTAFDIKVDMGHDE